jgi:hypothetical protein
MQLPDAKNAWVPIEKVVGFLLNTSHFKGRDRAKFLMRFGFDPRDPESLRRALVEQALEGSAFAREETSYGVIWNVVGRLPSPDGRDPIVTTGWIERPGDGRPRFTTLTLKRPKRRGADDSRT